MTTKIGSLIIDLQGKDLSPEERDLLTHPLVGGVILFTRNYESRNQLSALTQAIRSSRGAPLLIMADQEGGRVQRFIPDFTRLPPMATFGKLKHRDEKNALHLAKECGWLMATELLSVGVDLSLSPVLDLNKNISSVIGDRAFHSNPNEVAILAEVFHQGMREAGMAATGKHFPGHGSVAPDSHLAMPIDHRHFQDIEQNDLIPFVSMIERGMQAVMAAHILFPQIDDKAVGYSLTWLKTILRNKLNFHGVVMSDDLSMEGANISADFSDRVSAAREAGCDFTMICNHRQGVIQVLDRLRTNAHQVEQEKWKSLQGNFSHANVPYEKSERWKKSHQLLTNINLTE